MMCATSIKHWTVLCLTLSLTERDTFLSYKSQRPKTGFPKVNPYFNDIIASNINNFTSYWKFLWPEELGSSLCLHLQSDEMMLPKYLKCFTWISFFPSNRTLTICSPSRVHFIVFAFVFLIFTLHISIKNHQFSLKRPLEILHFLILVQSDRKNLYSSKNTLQLGKPLLLLLCIYWIAKGQRPESCHKQRYYRATLNSSS